MKMTLNIADDRAKAAKNGERRKRGSSGEIITNLARTGLSHNKPQQPKLKSSPTEFARALEDFKCLPRRKGKVVTTQTVRELLDREDWCARFSM